MVNKIKDFSSSSLPVDLSELSCRSTFGRKYSEGGNGKRFKKLLREFLESLGSISIGDFIPWLEWVDRISDLDARVERISKQLDEFLQGIVQEHMDNQEIQLGDGNVHIDYKEDFVDFLLRIHKENNHAISIDNDTVKAILSDIYAAGTDTTATVLEWAMTELLGHPTVMKRVQNEVREIPGCQSDITEEDLKKMQYLKAATKELFVCIHQLIPLLVPRATSQDVKLNGYDIATGTTVIINALAIGRDPTIWDEPEEFRPDRF